MTQQMAWRSLRAGRFRDRQEAGRALAHALRRYAGQPDVLVLALPRGGVPVAYEIARALDAPLDLMLVRKLGVPGHAELAMGAISEGGRVLNADVVESLRIPDEVIDAVAAAEQAELQRRARAYRDGRPPPRLQDRTIIIVDDGLVTGATMRAAVAAARAQHPHRLIVAAPVASREAAEEFQSLADELVCPLVADPFFALSLWYDDFRQTSDDEVRQLLALSAARPA